MKAAAALGWSGLDTELVFHNVIDRYKILKKLTGSTMVPVLRNGDWALNDSSAILEFAAEHGERPIYPSGSRRRLSLILEDFFDEWVVRIFGLTRWLDEASKSEVSDRVGEELAGGMPLIQGLLGRVAGNSVKSVLEKGGLTRGDSEALLASQKRILDALEYLFGSGKSIFGGFPTNCDFAFYGFFGQMRRDVSGQKVFHRYPAVNEALDRLEKQIPPEPQPQQFKLTEIQEQDGADRHLWELHQIFAEFLGTYWRLLVANVRAREAGDAMSSVKLMDGKSVQFKPRGYYLGRLEMILGEIDAIYEAGHGDQIFGKEGLRIESGLLEAIRQLADSPGGEPITGKFGNIPLYQF